MYDVKRGGWGGGLKVVSLYDVKHTNFSLEMPPYTCMV